MIHSIRLNFGAFLCLGAGLFVVSDAMAMDALKRETILRESLDAYDQALQQRDQSTVDPTGMFRKAARGFEAVLADGVSNGYLQYNLGNAYLQLDEIGKAILHYRRAARLIHADEQLQANLSFARSLRRNQIQASGEKQLWETMFFWHYETSTNVRMAVGLLAYGAFWLLLSFRIFQKRGGMVVAICMLGLLWMSAGASVIVESWQAQNALDGVTIQNDITVRKSNGEASSAAFREMLHEGVEFTILEERPGWYRIRLSDGNSGWVRQSQVAVI